MQEPTRPPKPMKGRRAQRLRPNVKPSPKTRELERAFLRSLGKPAA